MNGDAYTPTGGRQPGRCPQCHEKVVVDPSDYFGDTQCPHCRQRLVFMRVARQPVFYRQAEGSQIRERLIDAIAGQLGIDRGLVTPKNAWLFDELDSVDTIELVMVLEEEAYEWE